MAALLQRHWADNQVSCTVTFDPDTESHQIEHALAYFQYQLKGISFLPRFDGVYPQMPYEEISKEEYEKRLAKIHSLNLDKKKDNFLRTGNDEIVEDPKPENYCDADSCKI